MVGLIEGGERAVFWESAGRIIRSNPYAQSQVYGAYGTAILESDIARAADAQNYVAEHEASFVWIHPHYRLSEPLTD